MDLEQYPNSMPQTMPQTMAQTMPSQSMAGNMSQYPSQYPHQVPFHKFKSFDPTFSTFFKHFLDFKNEMMTAFTSQGNIGTFLDNFSTTKKK